jgi:hypothetical protein
MVVKPRVRLLLRRGTCGILLIALVALAWIGTQEYRDKSFLQGVIRQELSYFKLVDHPSGFWADHVQFDTHGQGTPCTYHAASKTGFQIAVCLKVLTGEPGFEHGWCENTSPSEAKSLARRALARVLTALKKYQREHTECRGFFPWGCLAEDGLVPQYTTCGGRRCIQLPAVDQGLLAFALIATTWQLNKSILPEDRELAAAAREVIDRMDFGDFYDPVAGRMSGNLLAYADHWEIDRHYYLHGWTETVLPVAYGVLHGQVPDVAFKALAFGTVPVRADQPDRVTFRTWRGSWHEIGIPLLFLPLQTESRKGFYQEYFHAHQVHAIKEGIPGFPATAYGMAEDGACHYLQMGLSAISESREVQSDTHAVFYANCIACLVDKRSGLKWVHQYLDACPPGPNGAWESIDAKGRHAPVYTTDAKAMAVLALSGGVVDIISDYLSSNPAPGSMETMLEKLKRLLDRMEPIESPVRSGR